MDNFSLIKFECHSIAEVEPTVKGSLRNALKVGLILTEFQLEDLLSALMENYGDDKIVNLVNELKIKEGR